MHDSLTGWLYCQASTKSRQYHDEDLAFFDELRRPVPTAHFSSISCGANVLIATPMFHYFLQDNASDSMSFGSLKRLNLRSGTPTTPASSNAESQASRESQLSPGPASATSGDATSELFPVTHIDDSLRYRAVGVCLPEELQWLMD